MLCKINILLFCKAQLQIIGVDMTDKNKEHRNFMGALPWFLPLPDTDPFGAGSTFQSYVSSLGMRPWIPFQKSVSTSFKQGRAALKMLRSKENATEILQQDGRFASEEWSSKLRYALPAMSYIYWKQMMMELVEEAPNIDEQTKRKAKFFTEQFVDMVSPSNNPLMNPEVIKEAKESKGKSLLKGAQNFAKAVQQRKIIPKHSEEGFFEVGRNVATTKGSVVARNHLCEIIQYEPTTETVQKIPVLVIAAWINKYYILDMGEKKSFLKYLVDNGFQVFAISWKNPTADMRDTSFGDYIVHGALFAREIIENITGEASPAAIGYCIGGTLLATAQAYAKAQNIPAFSSLTFFTTMVDFCAVGDVQLFIDERSIQFIEEKMNQKGYLDGSEMGSTFAFLRSRDLLWNYFVQNYFMGKEPTPFDILAWNEDSTRMPATMHSWYLRNLYLYNNLIVPGKLDINGTPLDLTRITEDIYMVGAEADHIAPAETVYKIHSYTRSQIRYVLCSGGHNTGIVNPAARNKGYHYVSQGIQAPNHSSLDGWKENATKQEGSFWKDLVPWLQERCGEHIEAPQTLGSSQNPIIEPAPGTYVLEK